MNPRILLIDISYPLNSRNQRIVFNIQKIYGKENIGIAAWNRNETQVASSENHYIFNVPARPGDRKEKLKNIKRFRKFIRDAVMDFKPDIIIASHWDSLILCHQFGKKGVKVIYENLDMPTGNRIIRRFLRFLEHNALRNTSAIVHASRFFPTHYDTFKGPQIIVENLPAQKINPDFQISGRPDSTLRIVYNGGIRYASTMMNLLKAVGNIPLFEVELYGDPVGTDGYRILEEAKKYSNIKYYGPYDYIEITNILKRADLLWAVYPSEIYNVKYAISNKYHESIAYGVPGVFAASTCLGNMVNQQKIGFIVDDKSIEDIRSKLLDIQSNKKQVLSRVKKNIQEYSKGQPHSWDEGFVIFHKLIEDMSSNS